MFKQTNADWQQGFTLTFDNGWDISVKWDMEDADPAIARTSKTAEVAAFNDDDWWDFVTDGVYPDEETGVQRFVNADDVADMIMVIKSLYLDKFGGWKSKISPAPGRFGTKEAGPPPGSVLPLSDSDVQGLGWDWGWGWDWHD